MTRAANKSSIVVAIVASARRPAGEEEEEEVEDVAAVTFGDEGESPMARTPGQSSESNGRRMVMDAAPCRKFR